MDTQLSAPATTIEPAPTHAAGGSPTGGLLALPVGQGAALVARQLLAEVAQRRLRLADQGDADALHDFRIALRRLRTWLRAFRSELDRAVPRKARRRLRAIARDSDASRDAEVHLTWLADQAAVVPTGARPGLRWLCDYVTAHKQKADERFRRRLAKDFDRAHHVLGASLAPTAGRIQDDREAGSPTTLSAAVASAVRTEAERLRLHLASVTGVRDDEEARRARIAGTRMRYVLEPVAGSVPAAGRLIARLKVVQDQIGELHDAHRLVAAAADAMAAVSAERTEHLLSAMRAIGEGAERLVEPKTRDVEVGLLTLARELHGRTARAFAETRDAWLGARGEALIADAMALATHLESVPRPRGRSIEIERKFLLREVPARAREVSPAEIEQGYVPGDELVERLRHVRENGAERWLRTVKFGKGLARTEIEEEILPGLFDVMWPLTKGRRVRKRRYAVADGSLIWEIDEFLDRDLVLAEVELPAVDTAAEPPAWLAPAIVREVTGETQFANERLAT